MPKYEAGMEAMLDMFVFETSELLEKLDEILMRTESDVLTPDDVGEIFRIMHTVKGSAAMMGLTNMSGLAHSLEDLFSLIREDPNISYDKPRLYELLYEGSDGLKYETENLGDDSVPLTDFSDLTARCRSFAAEMQGKSAEVQTAQKSGGTGGSDYYAPDDGEDVFAFRVSYESTCMMPDIRAMVLLNQVKAQCEVLMTDPADLDDDNAGDRISANGFIVKVKTDKPDTIEDHLNSGINVCDVLRLERKAAEAPKPEPVQAAPAPEQPAAPAPSAEEKKPAKKQEEKGGAMISVRIEKLDRLMRLVQELVISESGVLHSSDLAPYKTGMPNFEKSARELKKLTDELQDLVMSVRMVPISGAFNRMNRVMRDMNKTLGKGVELVTVGEDTEVDKSVADLLGDPLMHLVRNAVDHGIETPEVRAAAGKTEKPTVTLSAFYEGNDVLVTVTDNGAGMDPNVLLEKARQKGILTKPMGEYTDEECFALIMAAGFSTNTAVTQYSGRGVGMDVVKQNLEKVGGTLKVDSELGKGSTFTIRVPMSLSISSCMGIRLCGQEYALPITVLSEVFRPEADELIVTPDGKESVLRHGSGKVLKVIRLDDHFGLTGGKRDLTDGIMLVCSTPQGEAALFTDEIVEEMQIVIKPFSPYLSGFGLKERGLSGTSVLGDGSILLVMDAGEIMKGRV
ncbi:two-component system, chemotaxis family, sensor kinase CheA [Ruminococcus sp. YE71]|uniref:chemotaxis protein CheA n=1 Tax=unclassified Ruminococcus TaxID=2608920 RepID=UPI00087E51CD|nr:MULTISPECIES: chemotaxis protein CheA [unclassified Ruminococcus]SDA15553.1 two-component system, chemotaxis family, sensor kinase CheA [Ruminococcus sp. YE78]SFW22761.1 two-component system, chemotaxis family, sensor kinase CheA [Ruminococcus sp. YE71]